MQLKSEEYAGEKIWFEKLQDSVMAKVNVIGTWDAVFGDTKEDAFRGIKIVIDQRKARDKGVFSSPSLEGTMSGDAKYWKTYDERYFKNWQDEAQEMINAQRRKGGNAFVVHRGNLHHLYIED